MLFVNDQETKPGEHHILCKDRLGRDNDADLAIGKASFQGLCVRSLPLPAFKPDEGAGACTRDYVPLRCLFETAF